MESLPKEQVGMKINLELPTTLMAEDL